MSDNNTILLPINPLFVPTKDRQQAAEVIFREFAPSAERIWSRVTDTVEFFDAGENFSSVGCPACRAPIPLDWWHQCMSEDFDLTKGFKLALYALPCCRASKALNELDYQWPQAFARYSLVGTNADVGQIATDQKIQLGAVLGTELIIVYQKI